MTDLFTKFYLSIAGLIMAMVGSYISISTIDYISTMTAQNTTPSINIMSDLRGMGGMLLLLGIYAVIAAFQRRWYKQALIMTISVYSSFVIFRSLSFILDGLPDLAIMIAHSIEVALASLGMILIKIGFYSTAGKPATGLARLQRQ